MAIANSRKEIVERYLNLITLKSGLHFKYVQKEPYAYALKELQEGVLDLYVGTQEQEGTLASSTIRSFPLVIVTRNDEDYISRTDTLNIKTIALVEGSFSARYIESNYPEIKKIYVKDIKEGLELVASSDAFATVEILPLITLHIKALHMANVKISGEFPYAYKLKAIARADSKELISILDKAIAAISVDEHNMINDKWKISVVEKKKDYTLLLSGILLASILVSILIYSNWRLRSEVSRREALQTELKRMFDVVNQNVYLSMTDKEGTITYVSDAFCRFTGYTRDQLIGQNHRLLKNPKTPESFYENMWKIISSGKVYRGEIENKNRAGKMYWVDASITPIYSDAGEIETYMAIRKDITSQKRVEKLAITDALSDLYNRRYFNMVFEKEVNRLKRDHGSMCFIMLDIDHFKLYNDKYGHLKGDEVIIEVAQSLKNVCKRSTDQVFRLGGEEFGIVLINPTVDKIESFTTKVITSVENLNIKHEENHPFSWVTVSLGAVRCTLENDSNLVAKDIYQIADEAMYTSKRTGRNRVTITRI
jgi:diguanylate cyclase (GGDEF)-like protein/PAS domain S-box-containing protein